MTDRPPFARSRARSAHAEHRDEHVHLDDADWEALAADTELEGELLLPFVTDTAERITEQRGPDVPSVRRILDVGSGPGVGTCELARLFPAAEVVAVDGSPAMLERASRRAAADGVGDRVSTHLAHLPDGLDGLGPVDVVWASMSLHHVADETGALRVLGALLGPSGVLAVAEVADPMRVLPDDIELGRRGLADRLARAEAEWFAAMRAGLHGSGASADVGSMIRAAGLDVVDAALGATSRRSTPERDRPAVRLGTGRARPPAARGATRRGRPPVLDVLADPDDQRGVMHRADVFVAASRQIVLARAPRDR